MRKRSYLTKDFNGSTTRWIFLLATAIGPLLFSPARADGPIGLSVLYAGHPGSDREEQFLQFLRRHFQRVTAASYETFTDETAAGHDVVIFDWTSIYPRSSSGQIIHGDGLHWPKRPVISEKYSRPTVLIGGPGQAVIKKRHLKINWMCLCLADAAHDLALSHDVFQKPLKVVPTITEVPTPKEYHFGKAGRPLGETIQVWKVQRKMFPEVDPGLVSNGDGFDDSPDAEIISAGLSSKSPNSVALGRQGNFFLWGFSASPPDLMPEAQNCLVNVICYIKKFEGERPLVLKADSDVPTRHHALELAYAARTIFDEAEYKKTVSESILKEPEQYARQKEWDRSGIREFFPAAVAEELSHNPDSALKWVETNFEWIYASVHPNNSDLTRFDVDEFAKSIHQSNRKVETLDKVVEMLRRGDRVEDALAFLRRYTNEDFADAAQWERWLETHRRRLFFSESGGYKFFVSQADLLETPRPERLSLRVAPRGPVSGTATLSSTADDPDGSLTLVIKIKVSPPWHIAALASNGPEVAAYFNLKLPADVVAAGDWQAPKPLAEEGGRFSYAGDLEFKRELRFKPGVKPRVIQVGCTFGFQACTNFACRLPEEITFDVESTSETR